VNLIAFNLLSAVHNEKRPRFLAFLEEVVEPEK
jgi:hypothetical protein